MFEMIRSVECLAIDEMDGRSDTRILTKRIDCANGSEQLYIKKRKTESKKRRGSRGTKLEQAYSNFIEKLSM